MINAEVHSDDRAIEVTFDAEPYLAQASDADILALIDCGWGGDYPADDVARFFEDTNEEIHGMFHYLETIRGLRSHKDVCGFECHVDEKQAMAWVKAHRPHLVTTAAERNPEGDRLFIGVFPCGLVYADRHREKHGDYAKLAFLPYDTLQLQVEKDCPPDLRVRIEEDAASMLARRGQAFPISTSGQTVMLGTRMG